MTTAMTTIGDIFAIPDAVHQGDFVLRLTEGLQADKRRQTHQQYVVTPQLVQSFRQSMALIGSADFAGFDLQVLGTEPGTNRAQTNIEGTSGRVPSVDLNTKSAFESGG
ncbi:MAG: hypothetical protein E6Q43_00085 [Dokdonella sp.]|nr:MAG: hypothetical protein E6Q43_00085 [Dokdonella sp.]